MPSKTQRTYTEEELALFERYLTKRETHRPEGCSGGERCWVALGPPGYTCGFSPGPVRGRYGHCVECGRAVW